MAATFVRSGNVLGRRILGKMLLIPVRGRVADLQQVLSLNETAEFVWSRVENPKEAAALAGEMAQAFDVDAERAGKDVRDLLEDLVRRGFVERVES